ncbi:MAG: 50S ribosomal protein L17 [Bacteroidetes bacterium]|nr:50S ribosomal protein L17 [Bacteroidota bacterium]
MRHGDKINNLGRKTAHRHALLMNLACALIENKRIFTTLAKAKALRTYVEPIITKSKDDSTHSRRMVFAYLKNKEAVSSLFKDVAGKVADRKGGYTRIIKTGNRPGDAAEMAMIELVDFNEIYSNKKGTETAAAAKKTTRRSRAKTGAKKTTEKTSGEDTKSAE